MQSATSYFNPTLYRKNLTRFWPIWAAYGLVWLFLLPLPLLTDMGKELVSNYQGTDYQPMTPAYLFSKVQVLELTRGYSVFLSFLFGLVVAMAVFAYLYHHRSASMFHALPVRREGLFLTSYLSGLTFLVVPQLLVFLVMLAAEALTGSVCIRSLVIWLVVQFFSCLFFYSFAVFCAMFTGHILALPIFFGALNFVMPVLLNLLNNLFRQFLFGFSGTDWTNNLGQLFSPSLLIYSRMHVFVLPDAAKNLTTNFSGLGVTIVCGLLGLVLAVLALLVYRKRHLESAGDIVSISWVKPIFKYGVAFCSAMVLGVATVAILFPSSAPSLWLVSGFILFMGAVGYFAAEMFLKKTMRVFRTSWKGGLVFTLVMLAAIGVLRFDLTGFERRVPSLETIASAQMNISSTRPDDGGTGCFNTEDPEIIALVTALHDTIVGNSDLKHFDWKGFNSPRGTAYIAQTTTIGAVTDFTSSYISLTYTLEDGSTVRRQYDIPVTDALLADEASPAALLTALMNRPALTMQGYFRYTKYNEADLPIDLSLSYYDTETQSYGYYESANAPLETEEYQSVLQAVQDDIAAGRLGKRYLMDTQERVTNCYYNDLTISFYQVKPEQDDDHTYSINITLQSTATETLRVLRELGLISDTRILVPFANINNPVPGTVLTEEQLSQMNVY